MAGATFAVKGTGGAVANTAFMPAIPSKFTMAIPMHRESGPNNGWAIDAQVAANNVNLWNSYNQNQDTGSGPNFASCTLGATVTAPDGTNTATHLIESAMGGASGIHRMQCAVPVNQSTDIGFNCGLPNWRLAVIAKAAERTRIRLAIMASNIFGGGGNWLDANCFGSKTVFDLANGRIGVANTVINSLGVSPAPVAGPASISPLGSSWYLCVMDCTLPANVSIDHVICTLFIDNGSGTAAESTSYIGDGASGVNVWESSILPATAWSVPANVVLFDDFTNTSNIDLTDSQAPGFKWYIHNVWPATGYRVVDGQNPLPASSIHQSGSTLTIDANGNSTHYCFGSACSTGEGTFNGLAFRPPFLTEIRFNWNSPHNDYLHAPPAYWTFGMFSLSHSPANETGTTEMDFTEPGLNNYGNTSLLNWPGDGFNSMGSFHAWIGTQSWKSDFNYDPSPPAGGAGNVTVGSGGTVYKDLTNNNLNNTPASSPSNWQAQTLSQTAVNTPTFIDFSQMNTLSTLVLPPTHTDPGYVMSFFNGVPTNCTPGQVGNGSSNFILVSPLNSPTYPYRFAMDSYPVFLGSGSTGINVDWISVSQ